MNVATTLESPMVLIQPPESPINDEDARAMEILKRIGKILATRST